MASFLDELLGVLEAGATAGTGAVAGAVGMPYGLYKGITSGKYGTQEGVNIAQQQAADFMRRNTYEPRTEQGQNLLSMIGSAMEASKLPPVIPEAMALSAIPARASAARMAENAATPRQLNSQAGALLTPGRSGIGAFDPRFDPRVKEQDRLKAMVRDIRLDPNAAQAPRASLADFEGRPFLTSMADRTAAGGQLMGIDDVLFNRPVDLKGGQDYMFNNPGQVWASAQAPVKQLMQQAQEIKQATGQNPLYVPWRMAPTGGDFATMTGETMLAYADSAMGKMQKKRLDKSIKKMIPDWAGVSDPASVQQFGQAPDKVRKAIKDMMDVDFREKGGLGIGGARLAVSDPAQLSARDAGIMNVGEIFADRPMIMESGHPSYPRGVPGQGLGTLMEDTSIFQLMPEVVKARGIPDPKNPRATDIRALQMKPYSGVITSDLLKSLGY